MLYFVVLTFRHICLMTGVCRRWDLFIVNARILRNVFFTKVFHSCFIVFGCIYLFRYILLYSSSNYTSIWHRCPTKICCVLFEISTFWSLRMVHYPIYRTKELQSAYEDCMTIKFLVRYQNFSKRLKGKYLKNESEESCNKRLVNDSNFVITMDAEIELNLITCSVREVVEPEA